METTQAIRKLLFLEDCLIIPGLGGFVSQYRPAVIDKSTGTFIPPAKEIVFNSELVQNDGVLVSFIAKNDQITNGMARHQIDLFVDETRKKLDIGSPVFIDGVGHFSLDKNREIIFQADAGTNLFLDSFGLAPFHLREVGHETKPSIENTVVFRPDESPVTVEFAVREIKKSSGNRNLRRIAIAMPLLIAFSLLPYNSRVTDTLTSSPASMMPEPSLFRLNYPDAKRTDTSRVIVYPIQEVTSDGAKAEAEVTKEVTSDGAKAEAEVTKEVTSDKPVVNEAVNIDKPALVNGRFKVIAGCFKIKENAEKLHKQLISKGYPASIIPSRNGFFKVSVQSFTTRQDAVDGLARLKKAEPALELWAAL